MNVQYAILPSRVKAVVIDSIVLIAAMYGISEVLSLFEEVSDTMRIVSFILIFSFYDPFFTSRFGGTIGHSYSKINVKRENNLSRNISFPVAVIRYLLKTFLGCVSLLTVTGNDKKKAIHDFVAKSVVVEIGDNSKILVSCTIFHFYIPYI